MTKDPVQRQAEGSQPIRGATAIHEGRVTLVFEVAVDHYRLSPREAIELGEQLMKDREDPDIAPELIVAQIATNVGAAPLVQVAAKVETTPDGAVLIDFGRRSNFFKLSDGEVMALAQGLAQMARLANAGIHVTTDSVLNPHRHH